MRGRRQLLGFQAPQVRPMWSPGWEPRRMLRMGLEGGETQTQAASSHSDGSGRTQQVCSERFHL